MDNMSYILFICTAVPMLLMLIPIDRSSRKVILFMLTGMFCCLFISEVNGLILRMSDLDLIYFTTNVTPVTEEIIKAVPVFIFAVFCTDSRRDLHTAAFSIGVGFALLENLIILTQNFAYADIWFAVIRGFCSGLMHSICTIVISLLIVYIKKNHRYFITGTVSALNVTIVYHSVFNLLVQADSAIANYAGFLLPLLTYAVINIFIIRKIRCSKNDEPA